MSLVHTQVLEGALLCVIYLGALNDDRVRWQVDTPGQRGSRAQHLEQDKHHSASSTHASRLSFLGCQVHEANPTKSQKLCEAVKIH